MTSCAGSNATSTLKKRAWNRFDAAVGCQSSPGMSILAHGPGLVRLLVFRAARCGQQTPMSESDQLGNTPGEDEPEDAEDVEPVDDPPGPWAKTSSGEADEP
jgi:hypothetical protein